MFLGHFVVGKKKLAVSDMSLGLMVDVVRMSDTGHGCWFWECLVWSCYSGSLVEELHCGTLYVGFCIHCKRKADISIETLFIGVMSCMYALWDVVGKSHFCTDLCQEKYWKSNVLDDTVTRKVNTSDASVFAETCGCCPSQGESH